ncbi:uncharacterized protein LOC113232090 [Hyposmocoma kahamanoa]|uniref:uncharacterized protein LOC113232090 n=1 Tax=Hyposmocoma kahamanoa TaxID=1477025 RepID=UPI000E6DA398|nr:uncharacterized protein LOC113232090 [Hyposmocoma kahamanoa]
MEKNKTKEFFFYIAQKVYLLGASNYWSEDLKLPKSFYKIHDNLFLITDFIIILFIGSEWLALFTQKNLTYKQSGDLFVFACSHPILHLYSFFMKFNKDKISEVLLHLTINLKKSFNDHDVEERMIRRSKIYTMIFVIIACSTLLSFGVDALLHGRVADGTFTTVITAWPDVEDRSFGAGLVRIVIYIIWWYFVIRLICVFWVIIPVTILLSHQFKNLTSYFYSLSEIFHGDESQDEKERKYEEAFKLGIQWHADTLRCTRLCQNAFYFVYSGQILLNVSVIILLVVQLVMSERTVTSILANLILFASMVVGTGCLMWNAGDVTVEASKLPTAMFQSGWHNCRAQASRRVRPLVVIAMLHSQKAVQLHCLGIIEMSYESYISIIKMSYSVVSVLY